MQNYKEHLANYTAYSKGKLMKKCIVHYENEAFKEFDFSKYDLNNTYFGGVNFEKCNFTNVYLSGSNFGGSSFDECIFDKNTNRKSDWDDINVKNSKISEMDAFRTSFMDGCFQKVQFKKCNFDKSSFDSSEFMDVEFVDSLYLQRYRFYPMQIS